MLKNCSYAVAAVPGKPRWPAAAAIAAVGLFAGCAMPAPPPVAQAGHPPQDAQALNDAVASMTDALLTNAHLEGSDGRVIVIDPPVHLTTGDHTVMTQAVERRITDQVAERFPVMKVTPMTVSSMETHPVVLLSCMTPVAAAGSFQPPTDQPAQVYRIWASLSDTRSGRVVSQETAWVRAADVDVTPTAFFQDSPGWAEDRSMRAYLTVCGSNPGDPMDPVYLNGLNASIAANEGIKAYEGGRYREALASYTKASQLPGGDQMRVLNGIYLTDVALGHQQEAEQVFGRMVDVGLAQGMLAVKFVFRPASTQFWPDKAVSGQYPVWLREIALRTAAHDTCLLLLGHTSPTGTQAANDALSKQRATYVRTQLVQRAPVLAARTEARGLGSRAPLVGTARDDATDVLDRRVEFEPHPCETRQSQQGLSRTSSLD